MIGASPRERRAELLDRDALTNTTAHGLAAIVRWDGGQIIDLRPPLKLNIQLCGAAFVATATRLRSCGSRSCWRRPSTRRAVGLSRHLLAGFVAIPSDTVRQAVLLTANRTLLDVASALLTLVLAATDFERRIDTLRATNEQSRTVRRRGRRLVQSRHAGRLPRNRIVTIDRAATSLHNDQGKKVRRRASISYGVDGGWSAPTLEMSKVQLEPYRALAGDASISCIGDCRPTTKRRHNRSPRWKRYAGLR